MADYGTDDADDVDPNYDATAKACPQQGSESTGTVEIHHARPILSASNLAQSREADDSSMFKFPLSDPEMEAHAAALLPGPVRA